MMDLSIWTVVSATVGQLSGFPWRLLTRISDTVAPVSTSATSAVVLGRTFDEHLSNLHIVFSRLQEAGLQLQRTFDEHLSNLHIVFSRLQEAGLQLQPAKCQFAKQSIKYLGHVVSASGIQTDPEKVAAISQISPPKSVKDVRSFLGAASWYRKFVPNFARITAPLVQLLKKNQRWFWGPEQDAASQAVKDALCQNYRTLSTVA
ncbi:hypothetical protein QE152_g23777 [Popillia japonica]|uniref:RNA-directed DNA polymerase n=1 Tax=Popillia japonica TaxID=7064 RepID=A0AAW1KCM9_POPJA